MKVYDIALALVRALVLVDLIRELASLISDVLVSGIAFGTLSLSFSPAMHELAGTAVSEALTLARLGSVAFAVIVDLIILAAAPRIARFATKFVGAAAAATHP